MTLEELKIGASATIETVGGEGHLRQHFLDMGMIPGIPVTMVKYAPMGDPLEVRIHGYELTLRRADAAQITVTESENDATLLSDDNLSQALGSQELQNKERFKKQAKKQYEKQERDGFRQIHHPGLGEDGKYHVKKDENPVEEGTILTFALAGNQNCGKTTLFNQLTGANQHVGNFPGVTVDRKDGCIRGHADTCVTDLPGNYSMSPYRSE